MLPNVVGARKGVEMTSLAITRVVGVLVLLLIGVIPGLSLPIAGMIASQTVFTVLNTAFLFLLVTFAYEWARRNAA